GERHGCVAQMPRLRAHAAALSAIRPEESELVHPLVQPTRELLEHAALRILARNELDLVAGRDCGGIDDIQIAPPMMPTAARERRPAQDRIDGLRIIQLVAPQEAPIPIV